MTPAASARQKKTKIDPENRNQEMLKPIEGGRMLSSGDVRLIVIDDDPGVVDMLQRHFEPRNEALFELLGRRLWEG